ncbi:MULTISPECIES: hypothetical protein [unclassified Bacillus cereus group]|uniref:hypothetical protein n=1 Tax=unclassified Bacillus cereus group TaxID=2750818 RepID=UPI0033958CCD
MKSILKVLLVLIMFSNILPLNVVKAAQQYGMEFITKVELSDENGKQREKFSIHDNVKVKFEWSLPNDKGNYSATFWCLFLFYLFHMPPICKY